MKYIKTMITALSVLFLSGCTSSNNINDDKINIVTSFYPIYSIAEEIVKNSPNINITNMTTPSTGCLHDYQLTSGDMKKLSKADMFIINGGDMESFVDEIENSLPNLEIVDTSTGTYMLEGEGHNHEHDEHDEHNHEEEGHIHSEDDGHDHGNLNAHIWLSPENALIQAENIYSALCNIDYENEPLYRKNLDNFSLSIENLKNETKDIHFEGKNAAVFHEGYIYFANEYGFDIKAEIYMDENTDPSPSLLAHTIDEVKENNITALLCADDASLKIAETVSRETGAKIYILDPLTYGNTENESYTEIMLKNANTIKEAFK